jgi:cell division control protein 6
MAGEIPTRDTDRHGSKRRTREAEPPDDPLVPRRMRDHLGDLTMLGIADVTDRNEGRRGGKYHGYTLKTDTETVVTALDGTVSEVGVHQSLAEAGYRDVQTTLTDISGPD